MPSPLPPIRAYRPFADGRYTVTARLKALGDEPHFQVDCRYLEYLTEKDANRRDFPGRYDPRDGFDPGLERAIATFALAALPAQQPGVFAVAGSRLTNHLLGLVLDLDLEAGVVAASHRIPATLPGGDAIYAGCDFVGTPVMSALALQTQEDWVVVARDPATGADRTAALHVSFPSHWRPTEKIGRSFVEVHLPVAGIEPLLTAAPSMIETMIARGPWERFTWTLPRTPHLDEHMDVLATRPAPGVPALEAVGESCWLRVERQTLQGFPDFHGALFTIRLHIEPLADVAAVPADANALAAAVRTMTPASLVYKSLDDWHDTLLTYLDARSLPQEVPV